MTNRNSSNTNIARLFDRLVTMLLNEQPLYSEMIQVLRIKQEAIIIGDTITLKECVFHEKDMNDRILFAAQDRELHVAVMYNVLNITESKLSLNTIIENAPQEYKPTLTELRDHLKELLDTINLVNKENKYLLTASIDYVKGMVKLLLNASDTTQNLYSRRGTVEAFQSQHRVLNYQV